MKNNKGLVLIITAMILGAIVSLIISKVVFVSSNNGQKVEVVPTISGNFPNPDPRYFNDKSIDITQFITISNANNNNPFNKSTNN